MGVTKYPVIDKDFTIKCLGVCKDDEERGLITVLELTGMHVSSLCALSPENLIKQGSKHYLQWIRPKTTKTLQQIVPSESVEIVRSFLGMRRKTRQHYFDVVKAIGERAGYQNISPMTFRHNFCIKSIQAGFNPWQIPHRMGCTPDVVGRNYTKMTEEQLSQGIDIRGGDGMQLTEMLKKIIKENQESLQHGEEG